MIGHHCAETGSTELRRAGYVVLDDAFTDVPSAWSAAIAVMDVAAESDELCQEIGRPTRIGEFTIPPVGTPQRDFQALHMDFGVPVGTSVSADVARYTALYVDPQGEPSGAATRIIALDRMAGLRVWPELDDVLAQVERAVGDDGGEGILARIVEAVDATADLPSKETDGFLCGMEFNTLSAEEAFFSRHGLDLAPYEDRITLAPGHVMVFDNLRCAHGRVGRRGTGELHQLCVGFASATPNAQTAILHRFLTELTGSRAAAR